ncbi:efflux RND transporter periplasmic adaptor subunit [Actinoplanes sp. NPDC020271]|uniref:efflux RND transporter periplasmic adaptor subunit n=1 Tax=Actinoplanes sp. NPDC020271 TaxID=3363896 RepID=UPI00379ACD47
MSTVRQVAAAALAVVLTGAAAVAYHLNDAPAPVADTKPAPARQEIVRTDLSARDQLSGALGFGPSRTVKSTRTGIITWLPAAGVTITRGKTLYRVDDLPVPLFYGALPLYRPLGEPGITGRDVKIVADNLAALGYRVGDQESKDGRTRVWTGQLSKVVRLWQRDTGLPETGTLAAGDIAVQSGAVRVDSVTAQSGDPAASELLTVTATRKVITLLADPARASTIRRGDPVSVNLPDGTVAPGQVATVGRGTTPAEDGSGGPKIAVTVVTEDPKAADRLDRADVTVDLNIETRKGVLAVPVGALLALREGGYAVQLADGPTVAVQVGIFAGGLVEVEGEGLAEGTTVVTSS